MTTCAHTAWWLRPTEEQNTTLLAKLAQTGPGLIADRRGWQFDHDMGVQKECGELSHFSVKIWRLNFSHKLDLSWTWAGPDLDQSWPRAGPKSSLKPSLEPPLQVPLQVLRLIEDIKKKAQSLNRKLRSSIWNSMLSIKSHGPNYIHQLYPT